jgi:hypothetical protein
MTFGLDYVTGPPIAAMLAHNPPVSFVCRYLSFVNDLTQVKLLQPLEAMALGKAGLAIVSNYEWYADRANEGAASGIQDAKIATAQHAAAGGPADRPIYFSVDFDTGATPAIIDYFHGVASVLGSHRVGAYGSYALIKGLFDAGAISWGWQTYAWSGGAWEPRAHIQQYQNGVTLAGADVDYNRSLKVDFGQWLPGVGSMIIPSGWHDANSTLTAPNGVPVVHGFRDHVLNFPGGWPAGNWPLAKEAMRTPLEDANPGLGGGSFQLFRWALLEYTKDRGVFDAWVGQELAKARAEIADLKAKLAALPTPGPVDTTALLAAIDAIPDAVAKAVALATAQAVAAVKKL